MAHREYRYRLHAAPEAGEDGTTTVGHDIEAMWMFDTDPPNSWQPVPAHHAVGLPILGADIITALGSGTNNQKVQKYKQLIRNALDTNGFTETFEKGWEEEKLDEFMVNNDLSQTAADLVNQFITVDIDQEYPVDFEL